jgi:serine protease AprX
MNPTTRQKPVRHKAVWGPKRSLSALLVALSCLAPTIADAKSHSQSGGTKQPGVPSKSVKQYKLDGELTKRANGRNTAATTRVIVTMQPGAVLPAEFKKFARDGKLDLINGQVLELSNGMLKQLAANSNVFRVHYDRPLKTHNYRTSVTVGARQVLTDYGYTGQGIGVAVIDSGIATWHDDFMNYTSKLFPYGNQRVAKFVDFVNHVSLPYDDNGHGTHVAGIIGGVGTDSNYEKLGIAPQASLVSLKVLDRNGNGTIANLIAALGWVATNYKTYNIRVVNLSVGAGIYESYWTDPLTLAAKAVTDKGVTVVTAAGNMGKNKNGQLQYGAITAPGNAPWVLTVGATTTMGTTSRADDKMADYSSSGPTYLDYSAKPDLVAPGTGTVSLAASGSLFATTKLAALVKGTNGLNSYLSLSGTSMAAPVVSGTIALMLQANPTLTPNLIKAILQYTAQKYPGYSPLRQGAGFLNTLGAVQLARAFATGQNPSRTALNANWSRTIIWGNHLLKNGRLKPTANAWASQIVWGAAKTLNDGDNIVWGTSDDGDNIVWGTSNDGDNIVWGTSDDGDNIVWGTDCGGADCDAVVWGSADDGDNIVWGTADDGDNIVWGTNDGDNIVWGTSDGDNIVWGTAADNDVTWGDNPNDAPLYPDSVFEPLPISILGISDAVSLLPVISTTTGLLSSLGGF